MPRTKVRKTAAVEPNENEKLVLQTIQTMKEQLISKITEERDKVLRNFQIFTNEEKCSCVPLKYLDMTMAEIAVHQSMEMSTMVSCISKADLLNITKPVRSSKRRLKRSRSFIDDEGYLTAESVNSGRHMPRSKTNTTNSSRRSRSLSKNNMKKVTSMFKTPANKEVSLDTYGVVTPKCKPNTPQVILRRPQNGEVALSMQGSPLLTGAIATEKVANINIPLEDGRVLSLQPKKGLRMSQVPQFEPEILRQLQTLSDNLNKVFAATGIKK